MAEYIKREDALDAVLFALVGTGHQSKAIYAIRDVPTADVIPKEFLTRKEDEAYERGYAEGKTDVAREIFEEIDKKLDDVRIKYRSKMDVNGALYTNGARSIIAELKKKYTEETNE